MNTRASRSPAAKVGYALFLLAAFVGAWIGGSFLLSPHLDETSLPGRAGRRH